MTSVTERPTNAQPYCVASVPRLSVTPPAMANNTEGQLFCKVKLNVRTVSVSQSNSCS
jgi:hypothetical protein